MHIRAPVDTDWPRISALAEASVADVLATGTQDEWVANRRKPVATEQHHFVLADAHDVVGYGALEKAPDAPGGLYRMFVVTSPNDLQVIGHEVFEELQSLAMRRGVLRSCFIEYAGDVRLRDFLCARGYEITRTFSVEQNTSLVMFEKSHTGI